ncbi:MAG: head maturation protease, ClpP-related, partial [Cypionkella sp.]
MAVIVNGQEVLLSGTVGADWFDDGFTHAQVVTALANLEGDIVTRLNSGGGIASEGAAIHAALMNYPGNVEIVVEGIAASAASLIAMAGDTITMADGAVMMIHDPLNITIGNAAEHAKTIEELEAFATAYARIYSNRSGKTVDECRDIMRAETWYDGPQAVEAGFASGPGTAKAKAVAAYDYRDYDHTPKRLAALAKAKNWSISDYRPLSTEAPGAVPALADSEKEPTMTDKERADALAAELATANAAKELAEASLAALQASAPAEAVASADAAVKADRDRRAAIMALPEAKGREALADHLFMAGNSIEQAV